LSAWERYQHDRIVERPGERQIVHRHPGETFPLSRAIEHCSRLQQPVPR
jgi:hypothetical protein